MASMAIGQHNTIRQLPGTAGNPLVDTLDAFSHWTLVQCNQLIAITDFTGTDTGEDGGFLPIDFIYRYGRYAYPQLACLE